MLKTLTPPRRRMLKQIGPEDNGRRMSLAEFDNIDAQALTKNATRHLPDFSLDLKRVLPPSK